MMVVSHPRILAPKGKRGKEVVAGAAGEIRTPGLSLTKGVLYP